MTAVRHDSLRIALVQAAVSDGESGKNLAAMRERVRTCRGSDLILLPELWTTGYLHDSWDDAADRASELIARELQDLGVEVGAWIGGSMVTRRDDGALVNRLTLFSPDGAPPVHYDKGHLFAPLKEDVLLAPGRSRVSTVVRGWRTSLSICFDLRFPEMYRRDALEGTELFLVVSAWPSARHEVMRTLARARAIENQCYLALCNRVGGSADGTEFGGGSAIFAPDGRVLADGDGRGEEIISGVITLAVLDNARAVLACMPARAAGLDW